MGYEGLIRGPLGSPLHLPTDLFMVASANNLAFEVENLCCRIILERYAELSLPGKLFLNVSPMALELTQFDADVILSFLEKRGIAANKIVFELTGQIHAGRDYDLLRGVIARFRAMGFQVAIDDLGEGYSSLRRWSELLPEYIKIDIRFWAMRLGPCLMVFPRRRPILGKACDALQTLPHECTFRSG